jgi:GTP-binding protein
MEMLRDWKQCFEKRCKVTDYFSILQKIPINFCTFAAKIKKKTMEIKKAEFTLSAPMESMCPKDNKPEYAFIGRSNVGKSSLINMLTNNKKLAKTSSTPGKTLLINHFIINNEWYLVDLPGYGFAKRSKKEIAKLEQMINGYLLQRQQLVNVFLLVDVRLEAQKVDLEFIQFLGTSSIPFAIVFTKADKLSASKVIQNVEAYKKVLSETWEELPPMFVTSAEKKQGRDEVLDYIDQINKSLKE